MQVQARGLDGAIERTLGNGGVHRQGARDGGADRGAAAGLEFAHNDLAALVDDGADAAVWRDADEGGGVGLAFDSAGEACAGIHLQWVLTVFVDDDELGALCHAVGAAQVEADAGRFLAVHRHVQDAQGSCGVAVQSLHDGLSCGRTCRCEVNDLLRPAGATAPHRQKGTCLGDVLPAVAFSWWLNPHIAPRKE